MIHNINVTSNEASFYHEKGDSLLNQHLFADEQFGKLNGIFEEILQNKGKCACR